MTIAVQLSTRVVTHVHTGYIQQKEMVILKREIQVNSEADGDDCLWDRNRRWVGEGICFPWSLVLHYMQREGTGNCVILIRCMTHMCNLGKMQVCNSDAKHTSTENKEKVEECRVISSLPGTSSPNWTQASLSSSVDLSPLW
jgi:hypothetical protein